MAFMIREAVVRDAEAIARVHVETWKTTYRGIVPDACLAALDHGTFAKNWEERLVAGAMLILAAEDEDGLFGFASGGESRQPMEGYGGELYAIYLLREKQRAGAGRVLAQGIAGGLLERGFKGMYCWVLEGNPAVHFYRHLGGEELARAEVEMGGVRLPEVAFGWRQLEQFS